MLRVNKPSFFEAFSELKKKNSSKIFNNSNNKFYKKSKNDEYSDTLIKYFNSFSNDKNLMSNFINSTNIKSYIKIKDENYIDDNNKYNINEISQNLKIQKNNHYEEETNEDNFEKFTNQTNLITNKTFRNSNLMNQLYNLNKNLEIKNIKSNSFKNISNNNQFLKTNNIISENQESQNLYFSGLHTAKIRLLKGLDSKGKKKESFLNVKCVGLKANFLNGTPLISNKTPRLDNNNNILKGVSLNKNNSSTVFPNISKNDKN